jgi:hypothetical protein
MIMGYLQRPRPPQADLSALGIVCLAQNVNMTMSDDQVNQILLSIIEISSSLKLSKIILRSFLLLFF